MVKIQQRIAAYWILGGGLTLLYIVLRDVSWRGSAQLHTLMEVLAVALALFVGLLALIRFYSRGGRNFLVLGAGFVGVGFLDGYHALVTSIWFDQFFPSDISSLAIWSWSASRFLLSIVMVSCFMVIRHERAKSVDKILTPKMVYGLTIAATLSSFLFFALVPLPSGYVENLYFNRPGELVPAGLFFIALIGYLKLGKWKFEPFEHWLIIAIIVNLVAQVVFI